MSYKEVHRYECARCQSVVEKEWEQAMPEGWYAFSFRNKSDYLCSTCTDIVAITILHKLVRTLGVEGAKKWDGHNHSRCALSDALVKGAKRNGIRVKSSHKDGQLVVRRVA